MDKNNNNNNMVDWGEKTEEVLEAFRRFENERDDYVDDKINGTTIPFFDEDLQYYRSIEIPERRLSLEECELMVEYIIEKSHTLGTEFNALKHLAYLAYNSLLDVCQEAASSQISDESHPKMEPFFHKYRHFTEDWFGTKYCSLLFFDLLNCGKIHASTCREKAASKRNSIVLTRPAASLYERKATIGAWAFSYLAAIKMESEGATREYARPTKLLGQLKQVYSFEPAYSFKVPHLNGDHLNCLNEELLFVVLKGAIILENILDDDRMSRQRELLLNLAYYSLRGHCMSLMNWFNDVSLTLKVPVELLLDDMNDLLLKVGLVVLARNVRVLRRVHREYVLKQPADCSPTCDPGQECKPSSSKYFMYARLLLHQYFHCLGHIHNETTIAILAKIKELRAGLEIRSYSEVNNYDLPLINVLASIVIKKYCCS